MGYGSNACTTCGKLYDDCICYVGADMSYDDTSEWMNTDQSDWIENDDHVSVARGGVAKTNCDMRKPTVDCGLMAADARTLESLAARYKKASKACSELPSTNPEQDLAALYEDIYIQIQVAADRIMDYRKRILDGDV